MNNKNREFVPTLPKTRFELFGKTIKNHPVLMINLSLLMFVFSIPLMVIYGFLYLSLTGSENNIDLSSAINLVFWFGLFAIIGYIILYIGLGGAFYVAKRMAWNETLLTRKHFFKGIKDNLFKSIFIGFFVGISILIATWGSIFLSAFALNNQLMFYLGVGALLIQAVFIVILSMIYMAQNCVYELRGADLIKNSFLLTLVSFGKGLLLFIVTIGALIALALIHFTTFLVAFVLYVLFGFLIVLSWTLFSHSIFDQYINKNYYPDYMRKGLR